MSMADVDKDDWRTVGGRVPRETKIRFGIICELEERTPSDKIRELVEREVEQNDKVARLKP